MLLNPNKSHSCARDKNAFLADSGKICVGRNEGDRKIQPEIRSQAFMSDLNRGIMKFDGADKPAIVIVSAILVLGSIAALIIWALKVAYVVV